MLLSYWVQMTCVASDGRICRRTANLCSWGEIFCLFWLSCLSLTIGGTLLVSFPTLRMTGSQIMPFALAGGVSAIAALVLCIIGKGRLMMRLSGFALGLASLAVWWMALLVTGIPTLR